MASRRIAGDVPAISVTFGDLTVLLVVGREKVVARYMCNGRETQPINSEADLQVLRAGVRNGSVTELEFHATTNGLVDVLHEWPDNY
jgi:hypothetical protein